MTLTTMTFITISPAIANEYASRDVFPFILGPAVYALTPEQVREIAEDAAFYIDGPDECPARVLRAYRALLAQTGYDKIRRSS